MQRRSSTSNAKLYLQPDRSPVCRQKKQVKNALHSDIDTFKRMLEAFKEERTVDETTTTCQFRNRLPRRRSGRKHDPIAQIQIEPRCSSHNYGFLIGKALSAHVHTDAIKAGYYQLLLACCHSARRARIKRHKGDRPSVKMKRPKT